jgi:transposase-like protein
MHSITPKPPGSDLQILHVWDEEDAYVVFATSTAPARCPGCDASSASRHGIHRRYLQDLPIQGLPVTLQVSVTRWRCPNPDCARQTFTGRLAETARPFARRTDRVAALARRIGHAVGGRPSERLLTAGGAVAGCVGNSRGCLRRDDGIASGGEVNHALGGWLTEALPAIDLAHADLT